MRKLFSLLCVLLLAMPALAEEGFDRERLAAAPDVVSCLDQNGVDMVWRFPGGPFVGETEDGLELVVSLELVDLFLPGVVAPRITLSTMLPEPFDGNEMTVEVGGKQWSFPVRAAVSEYDTMYYEDYGVCLSAESLPLLRAMSRNERDRVVFTLTSGEEASLSTTVALPAEEAEAVCSLFEDCGGLNQSLEVLAEIWPVRVR